MGLRVVIVEQNPEDQAAVNDIVTALGHEAELFATPGFCRVFKDGHERCPLAVPCYDIQIINNLLNTELSGLDFIHRQMTCGCKIPSENYAVLSDSWTEGDFSEAERLGVRTFTKPFLVKDLVDWIYRIKHSFPNGISS